LAHRLTSTLSAWATPGRYRTNVWDYAGINTFRTNRLEELNPHPTVKPVALVSDAIKDCSRRGDLVLDPFGGSGTTLIAAQKTGRAIEYDPAYCDVIIRRFEHLTGKSAVLERTAQTFEEVEASMALNVGPSADESARLEAVEDRQQ
jgi:DNA modification methylase